MAAVLFVVRSSLCRRHRVSTDRQDSHVGLCRHGSFVRRFRRTEGQLPNDSFRGTNCGAHIESYHSRLTATLNSRGSNPGISTPVVTASCLLLTI